MNEQRLTFIRLRGRITPDTCRANPGKVFLFGDNLVGQGKAGQACIRDEPNAYGIPTKRYPTMYESAFFSDEHYTEHVAQIDAAFAAIPDNSEVCVPWDHAGCTLGRGLAQLQERAPRVWEYLIKKVGGVE